MSTLRDGCDQMRVGSSRPFPFVGDDELHLHAAPPEPDREIELELAFVLRAVFLVFLFGLVLANHGTQSVFTKDDADAVLSYFDAVHYFEKEFALFSWPRS